MSEDLTQLLAAVNKAVEHGRRLPRKPRRPPMPDHTTLADVQAYMRDMTVQHGFTTASHVQMTLIVEEIGELARVVKLIGRGQVNPADYACREEFADVLITVAGLANILGVDLAEAFAAKRAMNATRTWDLGCESATGETTHA